MPKVTFTDPTVASVGLTEDQARATGIEPLVSKLRWSTCRLSPPKSGR